MRRLFTVAACIAAFFSPWNIIAQSAIYQPLKNNTSGPRLIYENPFGNITEAVKNETVLSKRDAKSFYSGVNYTVWSMFSGGKVYFDGPLTTYLNDVLKKVLVNKPELLSKIKIYAIRNSSANAVTLPDGHIFVNVGLLAALDNEDQLAFILAHEVVHFAKEHAKQAFGKELTIQNAEQNMGSDIASAYRVLKYSRENEQDADAAGLHLIINTSYDATMAGPALMNLEKSDSSNYVPDFEEIFNNSYFTLDTSWAHENPDSAWRKMLKGDREEEEIDFTGKADDVFSTHPDMEKRILAINEILKANDYKQPAVTENNRFAEIKKMAEYEMVHNLYTYELYTLSLYYALKLNEKYNDAYYPVYIIKNLYMLGYLRGVDKLEKDLLSYGYFTEKGINTVHYYLSKIGPADLKKLAYGYMKTHAEELKANEEFVFYQALITETYLGKEAASSYYTQYANAYPDGKYITFVKNKQKSLL